MLAHVTVLLLFPQIESDIHPYKGLLMSLFFMAVGMEVSGQVFLQNWRTILGSIALLVVGKLGVVVAAAGAFDLSMVTALRAGLLLASGGEAVWLKFELN